MIIDRKRRTLLVTGLATLGGWIAASAGLLRTGIARAADWNKGAFESKKIEDAVQNLFDSNQATESAAIKIKAPFQAENGATVQFAVSTTLPDVSAIAVLVAKNERPLATVLNVTGAEPYVMLRLKLAESSDVHVFARSQGKLFSAKQNIKVTVGGCGG
jgi:sulfur-oxidizing protein SoxY